MKVLARKPVLAKRDPITGLTNMTMQDDSDDEDKKPQETLDEIRVRQQREREEKQRRYDEVRAKIFGDSAAINSNAKAGSGRSSGTSTPPKPSSERRGRGRGRGGVRGNDRNARHERTESGDYQKQKETAQSIAQSTAQSGGASLRDEGRDKDLYDPNFSPKPTLATGRRSGASTPGRSTPRIDNQVLRAPRGPDGSGRGGFGFTGSDTREV